MFGSLCCDFLANGLIKFGRAQDGVRVVFTLIKRKMVESPVAIFLGIIEQSTAMLMSFKDEACSWQQLGHFLPPSKKFDVTVFVSKIPN